MKLRPLADRVIVKRVENETKTASGIVIPDSAAEKPDQGEVLAVGPGKKINGKRQEMPIQVGARVRFGTMNDDAKEEYLKFQEYRHENTKYLIMDWQDICFEEAINS